MPDTDKLIDSRNQIGKELATLDLANLIGGPLNAVVEAQAKAAITTVNFIKEAAFDKNGNALQVNFSYTRPDDDGKTREFNLSVPFLTMLPIPYITVKKATIDFNAKITSTVSADVADSLKTDTSLDVNSSWFVRAKLQSKVSYQKTTSSAAKEERTYDLHINVEACNEEMPAGTERLLTLLEQTIGETKGSAVYILKLGSRKEHKNTITLRENVPKGISLEDDQEVSLLGVKETAKGITTFTVKLSEDRNTVELKSADGYELDASVSSITVRILEEKSQ